MSSNLKCDKLLCNKLAERYCETCNQALCSYHAAIHDGYKDNYKTRPLFTYDKEQTNAT